jgi:cytoskeleton protein RodZ
MTDAALNVGAELQRAREERGLALSEVAQQLKFAPRQLEALEQDRFDLLPGGTFARGMVRNYARLLKLDPEPLLKSIADRFQAPDANHLAARYSQPVPFSDGARRSTFVYLGLSLGVLALGGGIGYEWYHERSKAALAKAQPARARIETARSAAPAKPVVAVPKAQPKTIETAEAEVTAKLAAPATEKPAMEKVATAKVATARIGVGVNRLVIRCEEEAWIEVKDANDRMLVSSLNPAGAERIVQSRGPLTLVIGNAQHVRVMHNDRPVDLAPHTKLAIARFTLP